MLLPSEELQLPFVPTTNPVDNRLGNELVYLDGVLALDCDRFQLFRIELHALPCRPRSP